MVDCLDCQKFEQGFSNTFLLGSRVAREILFTYSSESHPGAREQFERCMKILKSAQNKTFTACHQVKV